MASKKILFVSKGIHTSSTRYRCLQFFPYYKAHDFLPSHVTASGGASAIIKMIFQASQADIVVVLRKTFPVAITWLLRLVSKKLIFDLDDAIFCQSDGSPSRTRMKRFLAIIKVCDHVFAGNQFLAEKSMLFNSRVSLIPTCFSVKKYEVLVPSANDFIDLVWIGSQSTSKYLIDIIPVLEQVAQKLPILRLKIIADFDLVDIGMPVLLIPWSEETEVNELLSSHIGIAPMINNDWTRGKCALKVLQYMAAKLPVVSSNVGVNGEVVVSGETGCLVSSSEQWIESIYDLAINNKKRLAMGESGYERVKQHYDINVVFQLKLDVLKQW